MAMLEIQLTPAVDGAFLPRLPKLMSAEGEVNKVNIMVGCLEEEGNLFIIPKIRGMEGFEKPFFNRTVFDFLLAAHSFNMDQIALDTSALIYMRPEQVGGITLSVPDPGAKGSENNSYEMTVNV